MSKAFTGQFFCNTNYSIICVTIPEDLRSSPVVKKMATHVLSKDVGRDLRVPVGGVFRWGYYVAITSRGLFKYVTAQGEQKSPDESPTRMENLPDFLRGQKMVRSKTIIGIFLRRTDADDCFTAVKENTAEMFDPQWWNQTRQALLTIGTNHPLVSISTEKKFAVPKYLYDNHEPFPVAAAQ